MPTLRVLSDEDMHRIHSASLDILRDIGMIIYHDLTLRNLEKSGALVDYPQQKVKMPSDLVAECVKKAPKLYTLASQSSENDLRIEPGRTYTRCASGAIYIIDSETGRHREASSEDVKSFTRTQDALKNISLCGGSPYPSDAHPALRDVCQIKIMLENTRKHIRFQPLSADGLHYIVKLASAIMGSEEELKKRPIISCITAPVSPLRYSKEQTEIIIQCGRHGLPALLGSTPTVGATGPVTLAGSLILQNAEILGGVVLSEVMNPGALLSYGPRMPIMDMRTGLSTWGAIESGLAAAAGAQMGQFYGFETDLYGAASDAKVPDEQAAVEKVFNAVLPALAGANIINGAGVLESILTMSFEQLVIDDEMFGMMFRMLRGIKINEETMAEDLIRQVGPGGDFLAEKHTKYHFRKEHFIPQLFDRRTRTMWEQAGSKDILAAAKEKARRILQEHKIAPVDKDTLVQLQSILKDAEKHIVSGQK